MIRLSGLRETEETRDSPWIFPAVNAERLSLFDKKMYSCSGYHKMQSTAWNIFRGECRVLIVRPIFTADKDFMSGFHDSRRKLDSLTPEVRVEESAAAVIGA